MLSKINYKKPFLGISYDNDGQDILEGLSEEEIKIFKTIVQKQFDRGIKMKITYLSYDSINKTMLTL